MAGVFRRGESTPAKYTTLSHFAFTTEPRGGI